MVGVYKAAKLKTSGEIILCTSSLADSQCRPTAQLCRYSLKEMTSNEQLKAWLESDTSELVATIVADIQRHVKTLQSLGNSFYGYAVLPGDYSTQPNPASLVVAFNRESDIAPENLTQPYYRYSVDEWQNYVHEGFDDTNAKLESQLAQFKSLHARADDSAQLDEYEIAFIAKTNRVILDALSELKQNGTFGDDTYLIIWFSDCDYEIVNESARVLNDKDVYQLYAAEFQ